MFWSSLVFTPENSPETFLSLVKGLIKDDHACTLPKVWTLFQHLESNVLKIIVKKIPVLLFFVVDVLWKVDSCVWDTSWLF